MSEQDATLEEFTEKDQSDQSDELDQEQFGPFTLSTPGDWTAKRLGDIKTLITRGKQPTYADEGVPVINQECIYWDGWQFENLRYLDADVAQDWKEKYFPQDGDVILNSTGQGTLGRAQVYPDEERRAIDSHVTLLRTNDELSPYFHRYFLESHLGQALLYSMCVNGSTGQIELSKTRLDLQPIPLPPLEEQNKIANVLYNVDQAIQKSEEIESRIQRIKRGTVQDLLNHGLDNSDPQKKDPDLGTVPEHWDCVTIQDIIADVENAFTDGARYALSSDEIHEKGDARAILLEEVGEGEFNDSSPKFATQEKYDEITHRAIYPDEVVVAKMAEPVARACIVPDTYDQYLLGCADVVRIVPNEDVDDHFLMYCLNSYKLWKQAVAHLRGTGRSRINLENISDLKIPKPPLSEQREIVEILEAYDHRIENEREYCEQLKRIKQGLMQDLLSGTVRTTDTNISVLDEVAKHG
ncbi:restriction endonuclease subunit S [Haloarcula marismortui]|uniref:Restriction endonuclease subunit S n=1 Tax=Haloarcula marismortui ATCC 33800 TaxID=662476 RepID=M0JTJ9_9EURY|nr:restriction endonuclease subunit S [Haloarcula sinaiiensis]EMA11299.1 type I site-specific deoxyribonuclease subunit rmeS [Haloarcula sinaiiensis ATCC 33800]QUJ73833.1 restriction endonuclease subunit S [Haloarcula sinaiiensis ATCC 33800]